MGVSVSLQNRIIVFYSEKRTVAILKFVNIINNNRAAVPSRGGLIIYAGRRTAIIIMHATPLIPLYQLDHNVIKLLCMPHHQFDRVAPGVSSSSPCPINRHIQMQPPFVSDTLDRSLLLLLLLLLLISERSNLLSCPEYRFSNETAEK